MYGTGVLIFLLSLSSSLAQNQTTHAQIYAATDKAFRHIDTNNDTFVELRELEHTILHTDANHDGRISEAEYEAGGSKHAFRGVVFQEMDYDGDGYVDHSTLMGQYTVMDTNADNTVSRREFDNYYTALVESAIQHYGHLLG
ncbi:uncharacterized protein LOC117341373 [Pecten maximus]|uniref:uncharacterized protein LOC117341373 n=1 Tax=Pecten maximus TaxID=6579 RepID=UPI0014586E0F|nr:uncharacterized protein LOC117341373 [Pecten maximus]